MSQIQQQSQGNTRNATTHGTQTMPNGTSPSAQQPPSNGQNNNPPAAQGTAQGDQHVDRPSQSELLRRQAADRKRDQRILNRRKGLQREDVEICQFCLYEEFYGEKPRALIRKYEEKELKRRQEQENRRRLLEKAKAKSRKTRKAARGVQGSKGAGGHANQNPGQGPYDPQYDNGGQGPNSPGDEFYDDEYDEAGDYDDQAEGYADDEYPPPLEPLTSPHSPPMALSDEPPTSTASSPR